MTDVKALLDEATPLPWALARYANGGGRFSVGDRLVADVYHEGDRELIARLPDYEAAVDALAAIANSDESDLVEYARFAQTHADAALRRLRGES